MEKPTVRVVCLPTAEDVREEAERMGVPHSSLEGLAGALGVEAVKVTGVPAGLVAALREMIPANCGTVIVAEPPLAGRAAGEEPRLAEPPAERGAGLTSTLFQGERETTEALAQGERDTTEALAQGERETTEALAQGERENSVEGERTQNSEPRTQSPHVLLAAPGVLLREVVARLESAGGEEERVLGLELRTVLDRYQGVGVGTTRCGNLTLEWGKRSYVMGILNVTPDSFSGDGVGKNLEAAVTLAHRFVEEGVDILDVGGESTRPGSDPVPVHEEIDRVIPVIRRLVAELPVPISIDSYKLPVVRAALEAGARMINDIWGLRRCEGLAGLSAAYDVPIVLMHNRRATAHPGQLGGHFHHVQYADLMGEIYQGLRESLELGLRAGVKWENLIVDPGIGFGKTPRQNLVVMRRLRELKSLGRPILMGTSRKSVVGLTLGVSMGERVEGTAATVAVSLSNGADLVRVHDVKEMVRVARMTDAIVRT